MTNLLAKLAILLIALAFPLGAQAGHEEIPVLEGGIPVSQGGCTVRTDERKFVVPCEQYVTADGSIYLALYLDGKIAVVCKVNQDGTVGEAVWTREPSKPATEERKA